MNIIDKWSTALKKIIIIDKWSTVLKNPVKNYVNTLTTIPQSSTLTITTRGHSLAFITFN